MARANKKEKQLTLHFAGDDMVAVLTRVKEQAKSSFRTPEQQALFLLATHHRMVPVKPYHALSPIPEGWTCDGNKAGAETQSKDQQSEDPRQLKLFDDSEQEAKEVQ